MAIRRSQTRRPVVENHLAATRVSRGIAAADLASQVGARRQTIYAIEAGSYLPNTELALRLADVLDVPIGQLFALRTTEPGKAHPASAAVLSEGDVPPGSSVHVCRVGDHW